MAELHLDVVSTASSKGLTEAAKDLKETRKEADRLGKSFDDLGHDAFDLERAIESQRLEVRKLADEFKRTGDRSLVFDIRKEQSWLRDLEKMADVGVEAGRAAARGFSSGFGGGGMHAMRGPLIAALVGAATAAAPAIGAVLGGAITGTAIGGGMAGGIIAASKDVRVRNAWGEFTSMMTAETFGGEAFIQPTIAGINALKTALAESGIDQILAKGAASVPILAEGIADMATNALPGLDAAMDRSDEFTRVFADGLGDVGSAMGSFLKDVSGSKGTLQGLQLGMDLLSGTIRFTGASIAWLGNRWHELVSFYAASSGVLEDVARWTTKIGTFGMADTSGGVKYLEGWNNMFERWKKTGDGAADTGFDLTRMLELMRPEVESQAAAWNAFNKAFEEHINLQTSLLTNEIDVEEALDGVSEAARRNGTSLDISTEAGRANARALISAATEMRQLRDDQIAMGTSTQVANAALQANRDRLTEAGVAAGWTKAQIDALIGSLFAVPVVPLGASHVNVPQHIWDAKLRADGGPVQQGMSYIVGEEGPELFVPGSSGHVVPNGMPPRGGDGPGGGVMYAAPFQYTGTDNLEAFLIERIRGAVQARGGELVVLGLKTPR